MRGDYGDVKAALATAGVTSKATLLTEYPDPMRVFRSFVNPRNGRSFTLPRWGRAVFDIVPPGQVSATESCFASTRIVTPLNAAAAAGANANGWTYVTNINSAFVGQGYDAPEEADGLGNLRFVRTGRESSLFQGPLGLTGPLHTKGTLHPNALGHQAIAAAIHDGVTPTARVAVSLRRGTAVARVLSPDRSVRNAGLTFAWDFDRLPGHGPFRTDAIGPRVTLTGTDPDDQPGRVATLRVTNALGMTVERTVLLRRA